MKLVWDEVGERLYETGVDHGVLFVMGDNNQYGAGVAWNGLTGVTQSPSGAESNAQYADNIKYLNLISNEDFGATINAFYSPEEFDACDGMASPVPGLRIYQQNRKTFGFSYRTLIGNDTKGQGYGYKIHLVYNASATPTERTYNTVNESPEAATLSWTVTTTPVNITGYKPTAHLEIDSTTTDPAKLAAFEDIIYGTEEKEPRLPLPDEVVSLLGANSAVG